MSSFNNRLRCNTLGVTHSMVRCKPAPSKDAAGRAKKTFTFIVPTTIAGLKIVKTDCTVSQAKAQAKAHLVANKLLKRGQRLPKETKLAKVAAA